LINANAHLKRLFEVFGVDRLLVTYDSLADAQTFFCRWRLPDFHSVSSIASQDRGLAAPADFLG
jgi:hypothetical protein